jgi:hypothetical protein
MISVKYSAIAEYKIRQGEHIHPFKYARCTAAFSIGKDLWMMMIATANRDSIVKARESEMGSGRPRRQVQQRKQD